MYNISKEFTAEYAHKLNMDYNSDCRNIHGHSAKIIVTISSPTLNKNGMIEDFVNLRFIKDWIDYNLDHSLILNGSDELLDSSIINGFKLYILPKDTDPTSENLSRIIADEIDILLSKKNICYSDISITFYETAKNYATYTKKRDYYE